MTASTLAMTSDAAFASSASAQDFDDARPEDERFDLLLLEHERRQVEACAQHVADAGFALDRDAARHEILDVAIDGALGDLERLAQILGARHLLAAHELDNLEQAIGAAHAVIRCWVAVRVPSVALLTPCCQ